MKRNATAVWNGSIKEGSGYLSTQSKVLDKTQYSFNSRFADGVGTNPEELMAAAHAGCFAMKLSLDLSLAGFAPDYLEVQCAVSLEDGIITRSDLSLKAKIPGLSKEQFDGYTADAKLSCPVSKAYNLAISLNATLV
ncbi:MAG: OsmC family peroxiredoxin [Ferruginibacter sp.]